MTVEEKKLVRNWDGVSISLIMVKVIPLFLLVISLVSHQVTSHASTIFFIPITPFSCHH
uniref:Uncharacterized protein n=1 Tax=Helianthus annuus TaxID=4232 RepID=A0A251TQE6_HELAN